MTEPELPQAAISTRLLMRIIILLIAAWSLLCGLVLLAVHGSGAGALGAGLTDEAGQRLLGAHLLVLVPAYLLLAWRPDQHRDLLWLPYASQAAVVLTVGYNILVGDVDVGDGILAVAVGGFFLGLLTFVWISEQRAEASARLAAADSEAAEEARSSSGEANSASGNQA